jgi:hypothetical protein
MVGPRTDAGVLSGSEAMAVLKLEDVWLLVDIKTLNCSKMRSPDPTKTPAI